MDQYRINLLGRFCQEANRSAIDPICQVLLCFAAIDIGKAGTIDNDVRLQDLTTVRRPVLVSHVKLR